MPDTFVRPSGPKGRHFVRSPLLGGAGPLVNLRIARDYGDISYWQFLHVSSYCFTHPNEIGAVLELTTQLHRFTKGIGTRANPEIFDNRLLNSEGEFWLRQCRLSQPAFHRTRIAWYAEIMTREAERMHQQFRK